MVIIEDWSSDGLRIRQSLSAAAAAAESVLSAPVSFVVQLVNGGRGFAVAEYQKEVEQSAVQTSGRRENGEGDRRQWR